MAMHPSILAWEIPWTEEPGGLQSMWSQRVGCAELMHACITHQGAVLGRVNIPLGTGAFRYGKLISSRTKMVHQT